MAQLFDRRVRLTIGQEPPTGNLVQLMPTAFIFEGLRVQFRIEKSLRPEPQKAQIAVYNLAESSRGQLVGKGLRVQLEAGYPDTLGLIYSGHTRTTDHPKEPTDWVSKFECGTAERAIQFSRVSQSFRPGASLVDVVKGIVPALVQDAGNALDAVAGLNGFSSGYAAHGYAADELTRVLTPRGLTWSIQDDRLQILGFNDTLPDEQLVLDENHGLIGTPELGAPVTKGGPSIVKVKSLLDSRFGCGKRFLLNSKARDGVLKIVKLTHIGDTFGADWYTEMECFPVKS